MLGPDLFKEHLLTKLGHTFLAWLHKRTKKLTQKCQIWLLTNFGQPVKIALAQICKHNACSFCRFKMVLNLAKYQDLNKTFLTWFKRQNYVINIIFWSSSKLFGSLRKLDQSETILDLCIEEIWLGLLVLKVGGQKCNNAT